MDGPNSPPRKSWNVLGTAALIAALFGILAAAAWLAVRTWMSTQGPPMPAVGYAAMAVGVVLSLLVGFALMALMFYSSRYGYDERASREIHVGDEDDD
jgi:TRAP-type C4-dicarboxylate transport system permease small subunit